MSRGEAKGRGLEAPAILLLALGAAAMAAPRAGAAREGLSVAIPGVDVSVEELAAGVWLHTSWAGLQDWGRTPANGLVVVSGGEAALVDTPWTDEQTRALAGWMAKRTGARLSRVVVTHSHSDCLGGLGAAHALGARSIALDTTLQYARREGRTVPREAFTGERSLTVGSRALVVRFVGPGHAADNVVVWLADARLLFGGCLVKSAEALSLGNVEEADLSRWPDALRTLLRDYADAAIVVPGHGRPGGTDLFRHTLALLSGPR